MLVAESDTRLGGGRFRSTLLLERGYRGHIGLREHLVFDTAVVVPARRATAATMAHVVLRGVLEFGGTRHDAPCVLIAPEAVFERVDPRAPRMRTWGEPALTIDLRVADAPPARAGVVHPIGGARAAQLAAMADEFVALPALEPVLAPRIAEVLAWLAEDGLLPHAGTLPPPTTPEPVSVRRLWDVLRQRYAELATSVSLKEVAAEAGISFAQAARDLKALARAFGLNGGSYREIVRVHRLRMATLFLTAPTVTPTEVALRLGYGSLPAMDRAFRDAGLPTPSVVQRQISLPR